MNMWKWNVFVVVAAAVDIMVFTHSFTYKFKRLLQLLAVLWREKYLIDLFACAPSHTHTHTHTETRTHSLHVNYMTGVDFSPVNAALTVEWAEHALYYFPFSLSPCRFSKDHLEHNINKDTIVLRHMIWRESSEACLLSWYYTSTKHNMHQTHKGFARHMRDCVTGFWKESGNCLQKSEGNVDFDSHFA